MNKTKVYKLIHDAYVDDEYHDAILVPKKGTKFSNFDEKLISFGRGSLKALWPQDLTVNVTGTQPVDFMFCTAYIEAVSERAKMVIETLSPLDVEFYPLDVFSEDGKPFNSMKYWAIYIMTILDALDWENTMWKETIPPARNDPKAFMSFIRPCLIESKIKDTNIFRIEVAGETTSGKFVSNKLRTALKKEGCAIGMDFGQVKTT